MAVSGLATGAPSLKRRDRFNQNVHGARGLFAFTVFVFHVVNSGLSTFPLLATPMGKFLTFTSEYGVELFFCISGYVITGALRRTPGPAAFLEDRAIRIYPVLWASILAIVGLGLATGVRGFSDVKLSELAIDVPLNLLALPGILPLDNIHPAAWSLSYEMAFYLFCTAGWVMRRRFGPPAYWLMAPAAAALIVFYPRGVFLFAGVLVAEGWPRDRALTWLTRRPLSLIVVFLLCWRMIQELSLPDHIIATTMLDWAHDARLPLALLGFASATLGFAGIAAGHGAFARLLRTPPLQYLGTISYSFYLWHPIVMSGIKLGLLRAGIAETAGIWAQLVFFVVALPPALLVSDLSQRILERRPAIWLRRRLHHPPPMQPASLDPGLQNGMERA